MKHASSRGSAASRSALGLVMIAVVAACGVGVAQSKAPAAPTVSASLVAASSVPQRTAKSAPSAKVVVKPAPAPKPAAPERLVIASIQIDNPVQPVTVTDGVLGLPKDPNDIGWWSGGGIPGSDKGATVLAAHRDSRELGRGVMVRLSEAQVGARIIVKSAGSSEVEFKVTENRNYAKATLPYEQLFSQSGPERLVIVTCGGKYITGKGYADNIIVTAVPVG
jgi:Sortase domain